MLISALARPIVSGYFDSFGIFLSPFEAGILDFGLARTMLGRFLEKSFTYRRAS
jgi:hypothetical protein